MSSQVSILAQQLQNESDADRLEALRALARCAETDRLSCALTGTMPLASAIYQEAQEGSDIEAAAMAFLNHMLVKDATLPFFIAGLLDVIRNWNENNNNSDALLNSTSSLGIINHRVYHPSLQTQQAIASCLTKFIDILSHSDTMPEIAANICRIIGGFGDSEDHDLRLKATCLSLSTIFSVFQQSERDSVSEAASHSALLKLCFHSKSTEERINLLNQMLDIAANLQTIQGVLPLHAVQSLNIILSDVLEPPRSQFETLCQRLDVIASCITQASTDIVVESSQLLTTFKSSAIEFHFQVLCSDAFKRLLQRAHPSTSDTATLGSGQWTVYPASESRQLKREAWGRTAELACQHAFDELVHSMSESRRQELSQSVLKEWCSPNPSIDRSQLGAISEFVIGKRVASSEQANQAFDQCLKLLETSHKLSSARLLHPLILHNEKLRMKAINRDVAKYLIEMLEQNDLQSQLIAAMCLVSVSCSTIGSSTLISRSDLLISKLKSSQNASLELCLVGILGNLAAYGTHDQRTDLLSTGILKYLQPFIQNGSGRRAVAAAMAIGHLMGSIVDESSFQANEKLVTLILSALQATVSGSEYQGMMLETWAPTLCLMNMTLNDVNKVLVASQGGYDALLRVLRTGDVRSQEYAARTVWNLAFCVDVESKCPNMAPALRDILSKCTPHSCLSTACSGALFQLKQKSDPYHVIKTHRRGRNEPLVFKDMATDSDEIQAQEHQNSAYDDIVVLYEWEDKEFMTTITACLKNNQIPFWVDAFEADPTLEQVSSMLDCAPCVLLCLSPGFQNSQYCRSMTEYAWKRSTPFAAVSTTSDFHPREWLVQFLSDTTIRKSRHSKAWPQSGVQVSKDVKKILDDIHANPAGYAQPKPPNSEKVKRRNLYNNVKVTSNGAVHHHDRPPSVHIRISAPDEPLTESSAFSGPPASDQSHEDVQETEKSDTFVHHTTHTLHNTVQHDQDEILQILQTMDQKLDMLMQTRTRKKSCAIL